MTRADLIARLEKEGGSRELDRLVSEATNGAGEIWEYDPSAKCDTLVDYARVTQSLDAVIRMCARTLPDYNGYKVNALQKLAKVQLSWGVLGESFGAGPSPAAALCIALLRALEDGK
jgi:hypothetical protein